MASPQLENGYTSISNEIMDALGKIRIRGEAMQVLLVILRKTYGWNKKNDDISLSQFVTATGINKRNVSRAIKILKNMNIIVIQKDNESLSKKIIDTCNYSFNKHYTTWKPLSKKITAIIQKDNVIQKDNLALSKKTHTKETITKTINPPIPPFGGNDQPPEKPKRKKRISDLTKDQLESFLKFWAVWPKHVAQADAEKAWMKIAPTNGQVEIICHAVEKWKRSPKWQENNGEYIPYPATWLNGKRWRDEIKATNNQPEYRIPIIHSGDNSIFADPEA